MKIPQGATVSLAIKDGQISLDIQAEIKTMADAQQLAKVVKQMGQSLPDRLPRARRRKPAARAKVTPSTPRRRKRVVDEDDAPASAAEA